MNIRLPFVIRRNLISHEFNKLRISALNDVFKAIHAGSITTLEVFPGKGQRISPRLKLIGTRNIRVAEIVGTFERDTDFDYRFRPLKRHSLDRWVNAFMRREQNDWTPVLVHKIDGRYFVEDGHHRVSVARTMSLGTIQAEVWEYATQHEPEMELCHQSACLEACPSNVCTAG